MKVVREEYFCDMCGCGWDGKGNVEYLGWMLFEGYACGLINDGKKEMQFCYDCYPKLVQYLWGPK